MHCKKHIIGSNWVYSIRVLCKIFTLKRNKSSVNKITADNTTKLRKQVCKVENEDCLTDKDIFGC